MEACGPSIVIQRDETETDANCPVISVGIGRTKKEARDRVERFQPAEVEHVLKVLKAALSDHKDS
jgi:hypothetical protein